MTATASTNSFALPETAAKTLYQLFQQSKALFAIAHKTLSSRVTTTFVPTLYQDVAPLSEELIGKIRQRLEHLYETDWRDARQGVYPESLLFDNPWEDFFRYYPAVLVDMPLIWQRILQKQYQQFDEPIVRERYPKYYLQNFHFQTNGYLSDQSANLYDLQVELLFNGAADAMRRRVLAPLKQGLGEAVNAAPHSLQILDVACGTGRTLKMLRAMLPQAALFGTDLSCAYLRKANQLLSEIPGELPQLARANAEELPYADNYFDAITCVFLFHELPPQARQAIIDQCYRVTKPGGTFVICDSIQKLDHPEFAEMMDNFPALFHEPYYKNYVNDDLSARLQAAGYEVQEIQHHFMSKYWVARKAE